MGAASARESITRSMPKNCDVIKIILSILVFIKPIGIILKRCLHIILAL
jgi:hypothetical protein